MGENYGRAAGIFTSKVGYRVGDDVGGKHRKELIVEPLRDSRTIKFVNRAVAVLLLYLLGHIIYALWEEL